MISKKRFVEFKISCFVYFNSDSLFLLLYLQYNQKPPIILLDCSKLQLGRGRLDDSVSAFRRRLELFRELTLPMLKSIDSGGRLTIVSIFKIFKIQKLFFVIKATYDTHF